MSSITFDLSEVLRCPISSKHLFHPNELTRAAEKDWLSTRLQELAEEREIGRRLARDINIGNIYEKMAKHLKNFPYNPMDYRPGDGRPIDGVVYDGLADGACKKIIYLEFKKAGGSLKPSEGSIKDTIERKDITYQIFRIE